MRAAVLASILALAATTVSAQVAEGPSRTFSARDLFGLQQVSDPQVRPDGGAVAYVRARNDIMTDRAQRSIWLADLSTGVQSPLVVEEGASFAPRWSPDGTRLAYVAAQPGQGAAAFRPLGRDGPVGEGRHPGAGARRHRVVARRQDPGLHHD
ncbi:hypothetical protein LRS10_00265 [Phenylobacterium sp. J426]|uniref:TolB family protein n=1 Tax=Phenylobacterium sp. J426 TaxID=2898439 RepID=UPI0021510D06|nr:hypothetical protein [Phenylobacterium sp. J426]MCR5872759.1 hypothetical protein [Phenylobacterium sp. J426]